MRTTITSSQMHGVCHAGYVKETTVLKEYHFESLGTVQLVFDDFDGLTAVLARGEERVRFPFRDIAGVPQSLRFAYQKLLAFLEDTYVTVNLCADQRSGTVYVHPQLCGGGLKKRIKKGIKKAGKKVGLHSKHSRHTQVNCVQAPPPLREIRGGYSGGLIIRSVKSAIVHGPGQIVRQTGGVGHRVYQVVAHTHHPTAAIVVLIHVWKRDLYANQISRLRDQQARLADTLQAKTEQVQCLESQLESQIAAVETVNLQKTELERIKDEEKELVDRLLACRQQEIQVNAELKQASDEISRSGPEIRALIELITMVHQLGIEIIDMNHPSLTAFESRDRSFEEVLPLEGDRTSLIGKTVSMLAKATEEAQKIAGRSVVALVGSSGVGKSTAVNFLLGLNMEHDAERDVVVVGEGEEEIAKIGHGFSETKCPQYCARDELEILDCGGFFDTGGTVSDIGVMLSTKKALTSASGIKFVLCVDPCDFHERGVAFAQVARQTLALFRNYHNYETGLLLMIMKPQGGYSAQQACDKLSEILENCSDEDLKVFYRFLLRKNGAYVRVCDPLSRDSREDLRLVLMGDMMNYIENPHEEFHFTCSAETHGELLGQVVACAERANHLFSVCNLKARDMESLRLSIHDLDASVTEQRARIAEKENNITQLSEQIPPRSQLEEELRQAREQKVSLEQGIHKKGVAIAAMDTEELMPAP